MGIFIIQIRIKYLYYIDFNMKINFIDDDFNKELDIYKIFYIFRFEFINFFWF